VALLYKWIERHRSSFLPNWELIDRGVQLREAAGVNQNHTSATRTARKMESTAPLIAGFSGGVVSTTLLLPLDVIKVRLQVYEGDAGGGGSGSGRGNISGGAIAPEKKKGHGKGQRRLNSFRVARGILKYEGARGLYVGWTPAVAGSAIAWGGYFYFYEGLKRKLLDYKKQQRHELHHSSSKDHQATLAAPVVPSLDSLDYFFLSCTSGAIMVAITNPIWLVKTRMQLQMKRASSSASTVTSASQATAAAGAATSDSASLSIKPYKNTLDAFSTIVRQEGWFALYRGAGAAFLLTSHGGVQFVVYEFLRKHYHYQRASSASSSAKQVVVLVDQNRNVVDSDSSNGTKPTTRRSVWERLELSTGYLAIGAVAKIVASTTTYPLQVVKARMQQRSQAVEITADGVLQTVRRDGYGSLMQTFRRIYHAEGFSGFFKGCVPNAVRVAPGAAITFVVYEEVMDCLTTATS
jgi:solute carrier family 25 (mitochondrial folate transporter), member 32